MSNQVPGMRADNPNRNVDLDIIKGGLVFIMLLYHCVSVSSFAVLRGVTSHIHFIHYAFLIMTGFLCGYHYYASAQTKPATVQKRLLVRAWKIFAVFLSANIFYHALGYGRGHWERLTALPGPGAVVSEFLIRVPGDLVAFEILYLIAAFLMVAAFLIRFRAIKWLLGMIALLPVFMPGTAILFIAFGCAGMLVGILAQEGQLIFIGSCIRRFLWIFPLFLITKLALSLPLSNWPGGNEGLLLFVLIETMVWFFTFLWCIERIGSQWINDQVILLGRYTFPAYIFQMICARIVYLMLSRIGLQDFSYYSVSLVLVTVSTWLVIILIEQTRKSWQMGDRVYRLVFQ